MADPVRVNLAPMLRFNDRIASGLGGGGGSNSTAQGMAGDDNPVRRALRQWAHIYRAFLQTRFNTFSRGGGDWKPLAKSTILGRRAKGGGTRRQKIARARKTQARAAARLEKLEAKGQGQTEKAGRARIQVAKAAKTMQEQPTMAGISILRDKGLLFNALAPAFSGAPGQLQEDIPFGVRVGFGGPGRHPDGAATIADIASFHQEGGPHLPQRKIIVPPDEPTRERMIVVMDAALKTLGGEA